MKNWRSISPNRATSSPWRSTIATAPVWYSSVSPERSARASVSSSNDTSGSRAGAGEAPLVPVDDLCLQPVDDFVEQATLLRDGPFGFGEPQLQLRQLRLVHRGDTGEGVVFHDVGDVPASRHLRELAVDAPLGELPGVATGRYPGCDY